MITAEIIKDTFIPNGSRITTFKLTYPRYILCEMNTHLVLSKNTASSRAIPVQRRLASISREPAMPSWFGSNCAGMQSHATSPEEVKARDLWNSAAQDAVVHADRLDKIGIHKQIANRVVEPFAMVTQLVTGTEWGNFFSLRCDEAADPTFDHLAGLMLQAYCKSQPERLWASQWHIPYDIGFVESREIINNNPEVKLSLQVAAGEHLIHNRLISLSAPVQVFRECGENRHWPSALAFEEMYANFLRLLISVSRCARVSFERQDDEFTSLESIKHALEKVLVYGHVSPMMHQGQHIDAQDLLIWVDNGGYKTLKNMMQPEGSCHLERPLFDLLNRDVWWGNFRNVRQFRKIMVNENREFQDPEFQLAAWRERAETRGYPL